MSNVAFIDSKILLQLMDKMEVLSQRVEDITNENKKLKNTYMSINDVVDFTGLSRSSINKFREKIGFTTSAGCIRFKRKDVEAFMEQNYIKPNKL